MVKYRRGKENVAADALSRRDEWEKVEAACEGLTILEPTWLKEVHKMVNESKIFEEIKERVNKGGATVERYHSLTECGNITVECYLNRRHRFAARL